MIWCTGCGRDERADDQQAADGAERVHGVGAGVHPGRAVQLRTEGRAGGALHLRAHHAAPRARQRRSRALRCQGTHCITNYPQSDTCTFFYK